MARWLGLIGLQGEYDTQRALHLNTIHRIIEKWEQHGSFKNNHKENSGRRSNVRKIKNENREAELVKNNQK